MNPVIYGMSASGNCYKVALTLNLLSIAHDWVEVDILSGGSRTEEYLRLNPNGKVPAAQLADGRTLSESNAIISYFADGTELVPVDRFDRARMLQWMFFEQYSHEPAVAVARFIRCFLPADDPRRDELPGLEKRAHTALAVMEQTLSQQDYLVSPQLSLADIALFAYTHTAEDSGLNLAAYPGLCGWLEKVAATPGFTPMQRP